MSRLKQRVQEHFPQLVFQTTKSRGNRELVYSGEMKLSKVVEDIACDYSSQTSSSETDDSKSTLGPKEADMSYATLRELYNVALSLRNELEKIKNSRYGIVLHICGIHSSPSTCTVTVLQPKICITAFR